MLLSPGFISWTGMCISPCSDLPLGVKGVLIALGHFHLPCRTVLEDFHQWVLQIFADSTGVVKLRDFGCYLWPCSMTWRLSIRFLCVSVSPSFQLLCSLLPSQSQHPISSLKPVSSSFLWCFGVAIAVPSHPDSLSHNTDVPSFGFISDQNFFLKVNSFSYRKFH